MCDAAFCQNCLTICFDKLTAIENVKFAVKNNAIQTVIIQYTFDKLVFGLILGLDLVTSTLTFWPRH